MSNLGSIISPLVSSLTQFWAVLCIWLVTLSSSHAEIHSQVVAKGYEPAVLEVISAIRSGELPSALSKVDNHLQQFPKSRIGHLLKADVLKAMAEPLKGVGQSAPTKPQQLSGLRHQIVNRWNHASAADELSHRSYPASLIEMGNHAHVIVADMTEGRLYLYRNSNGLPELLRDYYMSVGSAGFGKQVEGDNKTPVGVYSINRYLDDDELPDLYGEGAFPVDYPNRLDRYRNRTGYGIWLHGTPSNTYARSPWASEGCFVVSNHDFLDIQKFIDVEQQTPVILTPAIEWIGLQQLQHKRAEYLSVLERWKSDWESLQTDAYLAHYSQDNFNLGKTGFRPWAERKRQVNAGKTFVQVDMDIQSLFVYPGEKDMFVVRYKQRYLSNNYHGETNKEQYWQRDGSGRWRIIFEG